MIKLLSCDNPLIVHHFKNILIHNQIDCFVKNDQIYSIGGEVPVGIFWPELWIYDADLLEKAESILQVNSTQSTCVPQSESQEPCSTAEQWLCASCGESNDDNFFACWHCSQLK
ncbi:DUF2007 domain-containing protein [Aliikangiella maris]|uniref:DUF2007 domain-containing protein n=2 Tax=Aliikangiella maris TaxID=3162458 RepID=A0ABV3MTL7_9GAMM